MNLVSIEITLLLLFIVTIICHTETTTKRTISAPKLGFRRCQKQKNGQRLCFCGKTNTVFDRLKGERCINGQVIKKGSQQSDVSKFSALRITTKPIHRSARDDSKDVPCIKLLFKPPSSSINEAYVPLRNVSVEAWIDSFAADVTLTQVFFNQEEDPIEAIYVFPIEENAAVYSFVALIDNRTITAVLKEKTIAEQEYKSAVEQGQTAILMQQSKNTYDTFTVNVGALPPGKECRVIIRYVTELDLTEENSIRFVVPTTIAPRYNPSLGHLQTPDKTDAQYVQKTPYSMSFQAHVRRDEEHTIKQVVNRSHPVNVSMSHQSIDVSLMAIALDRDIILDIDLPDNRSPAHVTVDKYNDSSKYAILLAFTPRLTDFIKISNGKEEANTEFIFIVDCSGSMTEDNGIGLAKEAMLLFIRSLPLGSHFNIIRFGSTFDILFDGETMTTVYNEKTAKVADNLTRSMEANFGGTELLEPLKHLKNHPPVKGRSRQIFLLTDGEISNTNEVIELCRSMSSTTRIFSFGLGHSPSRSLVKGLARATNGYFVFVPPNSKVDTYVGSQFGRALQPSLVNARLQWHGLPTNGLQAPKQIPPLYINDCVLVYELVDGEEWKNQNISVDLLVEEHKIASIKLSGSTVHNRDTIRRLAAKALIQELQHDKYDKAESQNNTILEQRITMLSMNHQILSPYTAFVGVEITTTKYNNTQSKIRHIPIQISKGDEHLFHPQTAFYQNRFTGWRAHASPSGFGVRPIPMALGVGRAQFRPMLGPPSQQQQSRVTQYRSQMVYDTRPRDMSTTTASLSADPVRWLIDQQSFNGAWLLNEKDIEKLTDGKSLSTFHSNVTKAKDALTTAIAIAVLELKYAAQKNLWYGVVEKGRKHFSTFGLSSNQANALINEIKSKL